MGVIELFILAVGLSMDAFAVSVCKGLAMKKAPAKAMVVCGAWFGGFQALMPLIGYYLGTLFIDAISAIDHWIAFALLALIGINMLREALSKDEDGETPDADLSVKTMFIMAVATSIDALAVGVTFSMVELSVSIGLAVALIGCTTFLISLGGVYVGNVFGARYKSRAELVGGAILILIGVKVLLEHLLG